MFEVYDFSYSVKLETQNLERIEDLGDKISQPTSILGKFYFPETVAVAEMDGLELLVHNLSHSDMVLSINTSKLALKENTVIARPKFSNFHAISEQILSTVSSTNSKVIISHSKMGSRKNFSTTLSNEKTVPVGFNLNKCPIGVKNLSAVRFRHDDESILLQSNGDAALSDNTVIDSAYFPLLAVLIPKWLNFIDGSFDKVIVLVSGRGTPSVQNSGTANDNSTRCTAELMKLFIEQTYPSITVRLLHSDSNLFRYDENIVFVKGQLLPLINEYRDQLVKRKAAEWKEHMRVSLSFADGSSARISAINASLRYYRPSYMHFWQLKSFWREQLVSVTANIICNYVSLGLLCAVLWCLCCNS